MRLGVLLTHGLQRIVVNPGQLVERKRVHRVIGEIEQHQGLRRGWIAPDAYALLFELLVA